MYHAGEGFENAWYNPNDGFPHIWLWRRDRVPNPADQDVPDLVTQPMDDACILAHEYGHFLSHHAGTRTPGYEVALEAFRFAQEERGPPPTIAEYGLVFEEEARAWDLGRQVLAELGVDEWDALDEPKPFDMAPTSGCHSRPALARTVARTMTASEWIDVSTYAGEVALVRPRYSSSTRPSHSR